MAKKTYVADLIPGTAVTTTFLVRAKERKTARNGSAYLDLELQDSSGSIKAKFWDADHLPSEFDVDDVVRVSGGVELYQGIPQISLRKIVKCPEEEIQLADYLPHGTRDPNEMFEGLLQRIQQVKSAPLRALLLRVFEDPEIARKFTLAPAATSYHHAYLGGLLEHVSSLVELGDRVCDHYPSLERELVLAGLLLHDLGKIEELNFSRHFAYSTRGQLLGHINIGLDMVREKMRLVPDFSEELKNRLEHIILSHHGKMEFGSPKEPMFMEALVVNYLDDLDSKLAAMRGQYETDKNYPGNWTTRNRALGRELLKPVSESEAPSAPEQFGLKEQ
ncbi:MAG: HD domain-containing protein [Acidobacteria bacterium]|nr:HD domain-containing protein [Acidobacteriota bacterium]